MTEFRHPNRGEAVDGWDGKNVERKVFLHSHDGPEVTGPPRPKKDTRRWCRGKVGREHVLGCKPHWLFGTPGWWEHYCMNCGKVVDMWFPRRWSSVPNPKPDWVVVVREGRVELPRHKDTRA